MGKPNPLGGSWCKHCNVFVKDTPLEKKNHETSFKHQNNIQKTLRTLYKDKERQDREKEQAKAEIARLNRAVGSGPSRASSSVDARSVKGNAASRARPAISSTSAAEDRQRQREQLIALGVAIPDHHKHATAMPGEWTTVSTTIVYPNPVTKSDEDDLQNKPEAAFSEARKRKGERDLDSDDEQRSKKRWGTALKTYPGSNATDASEADLDALLAASLSKKPCKAGVSVKTEKLDADSTDAPLALKRSDSDEEALQKTNLAASIAATSADEPKVEAAPIIVFKKRKALKR